MQRIMIIGCGGAGKTTLAVKLKAITQIPVVHLDQHYWKAGWVETEKTAWKKQVRQLIAKESWIMDGNYGGTMELRFDRADTIIFLDRSKWTCLFRVMRRVLRNYGRSRADMAEGCPEGFSWTFLRYIYFYNSTRRPKILEQLDHLKTHKTVVHLDSNLSIRNYLAALQQKNYN